jgi:2-polyprenyl-6-methoxyphenol hydroxylase-like FAD-dependent oxidoreductase
MTHRDHDLRKRDLIMDADVIIAGAGPTGLMLAGELALAGVRPLVLEKRADSAIERGSGIGGQALTLLRYRGLYDKFAAVSRLPEPAARFPFGSLHISVSEVPDNPMLGMPVPQAELVRLLAERATGLGARIRYGQEVTGASQDADSVTVTVAGAAPLTARYVVSCEGGYSKVREAAGIDFPGTTYPEIMRMATVKRPDWVTRLASGDFEIAEAGTVPFGFTHTDAGTFAISAMGADDLSLYTEEPGAESDNDEPMTLAELAASIRRVMGLDIQLGEAKRVTRFSYQSRHASRYREGRLLLAGDAAHLFAAGGQGIGMGMLDGVNLAWKLAAVLRGEVPENLLDTYESERQPANARALLQTRAQVALRRGNDAEAVALRDLFQELLEDIPAKRRLAALLAGSDTRFPVTGTDPHPLAGFLVPDLPLHTSEGEVSIAGFLRVARPVLVDLSGGSWAQAAAQGWKDRVQVVTATTDNRPADALLIRPDAYVAWAAGTGAPAGTAGLREALTHWFGMPLG